MMSLLKAVATVLPHLWRRRDTVLFPEERPYLPPRYRGRIVLTRDPAGEERCAACYLCAVVCGFCEEACPTKAIQLTPDFDMNEYRRPNMVYEKEHLLISGTGKYPDYDFYRVAGVAIGGKDKGEAENEAPPVDLRSLTP